LSEIQIDQVKQTFAALDKDGNGQLSAADLSTAFRTLGSAKSDEQVHQLISAVSKGGNAVSFDQFLAVVGPTIAADHDNDNEYTASFAKFDKDHTGHLTAESLLEVANAAGADLSLSECKELIEAANVSGSGSITYEEFRKLL
ncbi:EF-hand, partial [Ramicandelaber brevisporus]